MAEPAARQSLGPVSDAEALDPGELLGVVGDQDGASACGRTGNQQIDWTDWQAARFQVNADSRGLYCGLTIEWYLVEARQEFGNNGSPERGAEFERSIFDLIGDDGGNGEVAWRCVLEPRNDGLLSFEIVDEGIGVKEYQSMCSRGTSLP